VRWISPEARLRFRQDEIEREYEHSDREAKNEDEKLWAAQIRDHQHDAALESYLGERDEKLLRQAHRLIVPPPKIPAPNYDKHLGEFAGTDENWTTTANGKHNYLTEKGFFDLRLRVDEEEDRQRDRRDRLWKVVGNVATKLTGLAGALAGLAVAIRGC
jgi:hypothetical protein